MTDNAQQRQDAARTSTAAAFVEIVEALVTNFDVIDVLTGVAQRSVELLNASASGILLADPSGSLTVTLRRANRSGCSNCSRSSTDKARVSTASPPVWQ